MGFTSVMYPNLQGKVIARVFGMQGDSSREAEDAAVTDVLEELLAQPVNAEGEASGSGNGLKRSFTLQ